MSVTFSREDMESVIGKYDLAVSAVSKDLAKTNETRFVLVEAVKPEETIRLSNEEIKKRIKDAGNKPSTAQAAFFAIKGQPYNPQNHTDLQEWQMSFFETVKEISKGQGDLTEKFDGFNYQVNEIQAHNLLIPAAKRDPRDALPNLYRLASEIVNNKFHLGKSEGNRIINEFLKSALDSETDTPVLFPVDDLQSKLEILRDPSKSMALVPLASAVSSKKSPVLPASQPKRNPNLPAPSLDPVVEKTRSKRMLILGTVNKIIQGVAKAAALALGGYIIYQAVQYAPSISPIQGQGVVGFNNAFTTQNSPTPVWVDSTPRLSALDLSESNGLGDLPRVEEPINSLNNRATNSI